jgi:hypothetical protein
MTPHAAPDAVIFVLLDAFRHDYLGRTRFLKGIAAQSLVGRLEEPFGFCPRGAYFGGLTMAEQGYTHLFRYDPPRSIFRWTRDAAGLENDAVGRRLLPEIVRRARTELPEFAAETINPWGIPLEWQNYFDFSEREAPWSPAVGYRSLFHQLDAAGAPWMQISWPYAGWRGPLSSAHVTGEALARLGHQHRFAFIHLPDLDANGHLHGPGSRELQTSIGETDRLSEMICARALELHRDPIIVFIGDHGMLPVVRTVDVAAVLTATGLRFGHDFAFFIDSTMVRCWFFTEAARRVTTEALDARGGGHWVTDEEKRRWQIDGIDVRNGEAYFLADPGVLFSPSFFDWTGHYPPRGMHGYAPDVADNQAVFLAYRPRQQQAGDVGVVEARRLYPTFLGWLGWNPADFTTAAPVSAPDHAESRSRWFVSADPAVDTLVASQLERSVTAIRERAPSATAVVLAGGFGRGEGTPAGTGPHARPANDYDILVLGIDGAEVAGLGDDLAREFRMDFVDISGGRSLDRGPISRLGDFDLRYGSQVLWGDPAIVERLGAFAPAELDLIEAAFLVGNRMGGMLLGLTGEHATPGDEAAYRSRQTSKLLIAIADAWLIVTGDYSVSYAVRRQRFADLAPAAGFRAGSRDAIDRAYGAKLGQLAGGQVLNIAVVSVLDALDDLDRVMGWPAAAPAILNEAVLRHLPFSAAWLQRAAGFGLAPSTEVSSWPAAGVAVYRAVSDVLRAWPGGPGARGDAARAALSQAFDGAANLADTDAARIVARLWLGFFH